MESANVRVSPRLPVEERVKQFYMRYSAQNGTPIDETDAELCAMLVGMRYQDNPSPAAAMNSLIAMEPVAQEPSKKRRRVATRR